MIRREEWQGLSLVIVAPLRIHKKTMGQQLFLYDDVYHPPGQVDPKKVIFSPSKSK